MVLWSFILKNAIKSIDFDLSTEVCAYAVGRHMPKDYNCVVKTLHFACPKSLSLMICKRWFFHPEFQEWTS